MQRNFYNIVEIDTIFKNCGTHKEIFEACKVFKQLYTDGKITTRNLRAATQFSNVRLNEIIKK